MAAAGISTSCSGHVLYYSADIGENTKVIEHTLSEATQFFENLYNKPLTVEEMRESYAKVKSHYRALCDAVEYISKSAEYLGKPLEAFKDSSNEREQALFCQYERAFQLIDTCFRVKGMLHSARVAHEKSDFLKGSKFTPSHLHREYMVATSLRKGVTLGSGSFGEVHELRSDTRSYAVKTVHVTPTDPKKKAASLLVHEIGVLILLSSNRNFLQIAGANHTKDKIELIMEKGECDLHHFSVSHSYRAEDIQRWTFQILDQYQALHSHRGKIGDEEYTGLVHSDTKLANLLLVNGKIRIADFSFTRPIGKNRWGGTHQTSPPEITTCETTTLDPSQDVWGIGIMIYSLITQKNLFSSREILSNKHSEQPFVNRKLKVADARLQNPLLHSLIAIAGSCLRVDPKARPSAEELKAHPLFKELCTDEPVEDKGAAGGAASTATAAAGSVGTTAAGKASAKDTCGVA